MISLDFAEIEELQSQGEWEAAAEVIVKTAKLVEEGGADFVLICTNTMHLMADEVQAAINIPLVHIADATARAVKKEGLESIGLLGTRFTMEKEFYKGRLEDQHDLEVLVPSRKERDIIHQVIYDELVKGIIKESSREMYQEVILSLVEKGANGIILGCTEIGLLIKPGDVPVPVFDTMEIHAKAAVDKALMGNRPDDG